MGLALNRQLANVEELEHEGCAGDKGTQTPQQPQKL